MLGKRLLRCLLILLVLSVTALPADKPAFDAGDAERIIQKFVQIQKPVKLRNWAYQEDRVSDKLDSHDRVAASTREKFEWRVKGDLRESRRLQVDGRLVDEPFVKEPAPEGVPDWNFEKVAQRYDFKIAAFEKFQGRDVARIHFTPKKNQPQARSNLEKLMSSLQGDLWVLFDQKQLLKARAQLFRPVNYKLFLARVTKMEIFYGQQQITGDWLPDSFHFEIRTRRLLNRARQRESRRYSNFHEMPPAP